MVLGLKDPCVKFSEHPAPTIHLFVVELHVHLLWQHFFMFYEDVFFLLPFITLILVFGSI